MFSFSNTFLPYPLIPSTPSTSRKAEEPLQRTCNDDASCLSNQPRKFLDLTVYDNHFKKHSNKDHKYSIDKRTIIEILAMRCACTIEDDYDTCIHNYGFQSIIDIRKEWSYEGDEIIDEHTMYRKLITYLRDNQVNENMAQKKVHHKIFRGYYKLAFPRFNEECLCVKSFCRVLGISIYKLEEAARMLAGDAPFIEPSDIIIPRIDMPKKDLLCSFLKSIEAEWTTDILFEHESLPKRKYKLIMGFYRAHDLYEWFEMTDDDLATDYSWFRKTWLREFPHLICSKDRACLTCNSCLEAMKSCEGKDNQAYQNARSIFKEHCRNFKDLREYFDLKITSSRLQNHSSGASVCFIMDHFGIHYIPAWKQSLSEFKSLEGHGILGVYMSGMHNATTKSTDYLIYNEPFSEDSNVNCYHLDRFLSSWKKEHPNCVEFNFASDTSAKIRSNLLIALLDFRIRVQQCLGPQGHCWFVLYDKDHHEHAGDRAHKLLQDRWTTSLRNNKPIGDMDQVLKNFQGIRNYTFNYIAAIPDYKTFLKDCYVDFPSIASVHVFHITQEGIHSTANNSTDTNWRTNNSIEPFKMIFKKPAFNIPSLIPPPKLNQERLDAIKKVKKPLNTEIFWNNINQGGVGTTDQFYLNPNLNEILSYAHLPLAAASTTTMLTNTSASMKERPNSVSAESKVASLGKLIVFPSEEEAARKNIDREYLLETTFADEPDVTHFCARKDLIDDNGVKNEMFASWEKEHKGLAIKFTHGYVETKSQKKSKKTLAPSDVGPLLANGRSNPPTKKARK